ncbi:hypothetical protein ACOMHN_063138 [Nucella lapillus]
MKTMKIGDKNIKVSARKNINCSAGAMEMEGALILFKRSVQLHGFRYTEMLGDGDTKTHSRLLQEDPYDERPIKKLKRPILVVFLPASHCKQHPSPPHKRSLPASVAQALKPIYERLGDPQLLRRCLAGKTQNSNESFHSVLWSLCPKERWGNLRTVDTALAIAVQRFNKGASALQDVMLELELVTGSTVEDFALKEDTARVRKATKKSSDKEKEKRKKMDTVRRREQQERREREGEVYRPGQF